MAFFLDESNLISIDPSDLKIDVSRSIHLVYPDRSITFYISLSLVSLCTQAWSFLTVFRVSLPYL